MFAANAAGGSQLSLTWNNTHSYTKFANTRNQCKKKCNLLDCHVNRNVSHALDNFIFDPGYSLDTSEKLNHRSNIFNSTEKCQLMHILS